MSLRNWTGNLPWKLASLGLAILAWLLFSGSREHTASVSVPVQYRNLPHELDISSDMVEQVHLSLRGPASRLSRVTSASLPIVIDLRGVTSPGERTFSVNADNLTLPAGVTVERVVPSQIRLRLEMRKRVQVPVMVRFSAKIDRPVEVIPPALEVIGPESRVSRISQVETDPVDVETLTERGQVKTEAFSGDPQVRFAGSSVVLVKVKGFAAQEHSTTTDKGK